MIPNEADGAFIPYPGGSVFNTAIGLGRQGVEVAFLSGVSSDLFGTQLCDALRESYVSTEFLIRSDRPTTLAFVNLVEGKASYAFYDENTAGRLLHINDMIKKLPSEISTLFFGGISLAIEPCADAYVDFLIRNANDHLVMVDPNIRSNFIGDEAHYRGRLDKVLSHADIVKVSEEDLNWMDQRKVSIDQKINAVFNQGPSLVCLTLDAQGARIFSNKGLLASSMTPVIDVVDTVGAGDAFNAGFLTCLNRRGMLSKSAITSIDADELQRAADFATSFASDTVTRRGSDPAWNFASGADDA